MIESWIAWKFVSLKRLTTFIILSIGKILFNVVIVIKNSGKPIILNSLYNHYMDIPWIIQTIKKPNILLSFFTYLMRWYNSCRTSHSLYLILLFLSGASCSLCPHDRKSERSGIDVKSLNQCTPERTNLAVFYPKSCPQKLGIIWAVDELINHNNKSFWLNIDRFYWRNISELRIKKPTCFQVGFLTFLRSVKFF